MSTLRMRACAPRFTIQPHMQRKTSQARKHASTLALARTPMPLATRLRFTSAGTALAGGLLGAHVAALGTEQEVAVLHSYQAPGDCPSALVFMDHFASRTQRVRITSSSSATNLSLVVTLSHEDGQVVGRLAMRSRSGVTSHRVVSAQSCDEVVPALAFVAALAADPSAQGPTRAPALSGATPTPPNASPARQVPQTSDTATPSVVATRKQNHQNEAQKSPWQGLAQSRPWVWSLASQLGAISGPVPAWSPLGALFLELEVPQTVWDARALFGVGVIGALPSDQETRPGTVRFQWLTAATVICPVMLELSDQWSTAPCMTGELGMLRGTASEISAPGARTRWWRTVGAAVRLRWVPDSRYFLYSEAAMTSPLTRDEFGIMNEGQFIEVHRIPLFAGRVGMGLGLFL